MKFRHKTSLFSSSTVIVLGLFSLFAWSQNQRSSLSPKTNAAVCCTGSTYCGSFAYNQCRTDSSCYWTCAVPSSTPTPTPTPVCCVGSYSYCNSFGYLTCKSDSSCFWACAVPSSTPTPTTKPSPSPTPTPIPCPKVTSTIPGSTATRTVAWCSQGYFSWANTGFPVSCSNTAKNSYKWRGCGQAVISSVLCSYVGSGYCNVKTTTNSVTPLTQSTCEGITAEPVSSALSNFSTYFSAQTIIHPITWDKINQNLIYGPVILGAKFKDKQGTVWLDHWTLVTGISNGKRQYNDPYFNSDYIYGTKITSRYLEDFVDIDLSTADAISVRK